MARYSVATLDEIDEVDGGQNAFRPVRHHFGITSFGIIATTAPEVGGVLVKEHTESEPESGEELYVVISGRASFEVDDELTDAPAGTFVHVPAGVKRKATAQEAGSTVLAIGAGPSGKPYEPSGWEICATLFSLYAAEDFAGAADAAEAVLLDDPPYALAA